MMIISTTVFEVTMSVWYVIISFLLLIHYVNMRPWPFHLVQY